MGRREINIEKNILEVSNLKKTFQKSGFCLDDVSFTLPYGSIMGFVGENGAGKTTTIGCVLGTLKRDEGSVKLFGEEINGCDIRTDIKEQIGVVYDASNFSGDLTPRKISKIMNGIYSQWDDAVFMNYLEKFRLPLDQKTGTFSRGMTMKLAFAAAVSHSPRLLVLDEVTGGLDPIARDEMLEMFLDFVQDETRSIFLSSHITGELEKIADYITFLHEGKVLLSACTDDLLYQYGIVKCKTKQFEQIEKQDIVSYLKRDCQVEILVSDKEQIRQKYNGLIIDDATIDNILLLLVKGSRQI